MKISIITVCRNSAATIGDTLRSVAAQNHPDVEHLVIDGVSTDTTLDVVRVHGAHVAKLVSEKDHGIYDAMNKGAELATGEVIGFLNSDDWYAGPDVLTWVAAAFQAGVDLAYGDLRFVTPEAPFECRRIWRDATHLAADFFRTGWHPAHPSTFVRREVFRASGGFDPRWKIGADYAFLGRVMRQPNLQMRYVPETLVNMRIGGVSTGGHAAIWRANRECAQALQELGVLWPWRIITMKTVRKLPQLWVRERSGFASKEVWRPWVI